MAEIQMSNIYKDVVRTLNQAKKISQVFNEHLKEKLDLENQFFKNNKDKEIVLILKEEEISGVLLDINRYRIELKVNNKSIFYNKSQILGFYAKN